jgi:hypothetical protein
MENEQTANREADVLYGYVDGSDLDEIAESVQSELIRFVESHAWKTGAPSVVNQRHGPRETDWDLGLNMACLDPESLAFAAWFDDLTAVLDFLHHLGPRVGREFVIGIADSETGVADDLLFIGEEPVSRSQLCLVMGWPDR